MKIGFIGTGNMARAMIRGMLVSGIKPEDIIASAKSLSSRESAAKESCDNNAGSPLVAKIGMKLCLTMYHKNRVQISDLPQEHQDVRRCHGVKK